ncbi:MAG: low molecular weight phosphatase family protein [Pyrinomonadaceae bacterium]
MNKKVLFLCTGNYYRSRFAELYFNFLAEKSNLNWRADSRGFAPGAHNIGAISRYVLQRLENLQIPFDKAQRFPLQVSLADLENADLVVALYDIEHRPFVSQDFPLWIERIEFWQVADVPFTLPEIALPAIQKQVENLIARLKLEM